MLQELTVESFALIDTLTLQFGPGFTVLTGETGAGKSIIIDALNAVLGQRVGPESIRRGQSAARIEALFDAADAPRALAVLEQAGLREGDDTTVILSREIAGGRSTCRVNRRVATLGLLQDIGRYLVDIHGQHEHQSLLHEDSHLSFLDEFGGPDLRDLRARYEDEFARFQQAQRDLQDLHLGERERAQRADVLRFQVAEIEQAGLEPAEEDLLRNERSRLQHAERICQAVAVARDLLDGEVDGALAALPALETAGQELRTVARLDPELAATADELDTAGVVVHEVVRSLAGYLAAVQADPERLEAIERRLADIAALKRKYGDSVAEVLAFYDQAAAELMHLEHLESDEEQLREHLARERERAGHTAEALSAARAELAHGLRQVVTAELTELGMQAATFDVLLERHDDPAGLPGADGRGHRATRRGIDRCAFQFSANAGEAPRPLSKIASGGELSRLMLVFKSLCSRGAEIATIVFDEIDAGIGGRVAHAVADKLVAVSAASQVLCVTHLAQIARLADAQVVVTKLVRAGRTLVCAEPLTEAARITEIARMLGATERDATAHRHAHELLASAPAHREDVRTRATAVRVSS